MNKIKRKRKPMSDEHKAALSRALKGRYVSDETRQLMSLAKLGRKFTEEHKQALRDGWARHNAKRAAEFEENKKWGVDDESL